MSAFFIADSNSVLSKYVPCLNVSHNNQIAIVMDLPGVVHTVCCDRSDHNPVQSDKGGSIPCS
jgi:hypothetical protein